MGNHICPDTPTIVSINIGKLGDQDFKISFKGRKLIYTPLSSDNEEMITEHEFCPFCGEKLNRTGMFHVEAIVRFDDQIGSEINLSEDFDYTSRYGDMSDEELQNSLTEHFYNEAMEYINIEIQITVIEEE